MIDMVLRSGGNRSAKNHNQQFSTKETERCQLNLNTATKAENIKQIAALKVYEQF